MLVDCGEREGAEIETRTTSATKNRIPTLHTTQNLDEFLSAKHSIWSGHLWNGLLKGSGRCFLLDKIWGEFIARECFSTENHKIYKVMRVVFQFWVQERAKYARRGARTLRPPAELCFPSSEQLQTTMLRPSQWVEGVTVSWVRTVKQF